MAVIEAFNLNTTDTRSRIIPVGSAATISVQVVATGWGSTAVVELQYTLDEVAIDDTNNWLSFTDAIEFSSTTTSVLERGILGAAYISFKVTTAGDGSADATAKVFYRLHA